MYKEGTPNDAQADWFKPSKPQEELYDYVRIDDINRLDAAAGLERVTIFSPDGAADYMRTRLNRMSDETFSLFIEYQKIVSERSDLIATVVGIVPHDSHLVTLGKLSRLVAADIRG